MRAENTHRRPDLTLEDTTNKTILLIDMACPIESNKDTKRMNKITRYRMLMIKNLNLLHEKCKRPYSWKASL